MKEGIGQSQSIVPQKPQNGTNNAPQSNQTAVMRLMNDGYFCAHRALSARQLSAH